MIFVTSAVDLRFLLHLADSVVREFQKTKSIVIIYLFSNSLSSKSQTLFRVPERSVCIFCGSSSFLVRMNTQIIFNRSVVPGLLNPLLGFLL